MSWHRRQWTSASWSPWETWPIEAVDDHHMTKLIIMIHHDPNEATLPIKTVGTIIWYYDDHHEILFYDDHEMILCGWYEATLPIEAAGPCWLEIRRLWSGSPEPAHRRHCNYYDFHCIDDYHHIYDHYEVVVQRLLIVMIVMGLMIITIIMIIVIFTLETSPV